MRSSTVWRLAAQRAEMRVLAFLAHSNHHHTIVVDTHGRMPEFLETFHKLVAKHQNALRGRWENFWASEATSVVELMGPEDILAKMTYALTNPVKDGLIDRADQWPGASSLWANLNGRPLVCAPPDSISFAKTAICPHSVTLDIEEPPGLDHLGSAEWRKLLADRIRVSRGGRSGREVHGRTTNPWSGGGTETASDGQAAVTRTAAANESARGERKQVGPNRDHPAEQGVRGCLSRGAQPLENRGGGVLSGGNVLAAKVRRRAHRGPRCFCNSSDRFDLTAPAHLGNGSCIPAASAVPVGPVAR